MGTPTMLMGRPGPWSGKAILLLLAVAMLTEARGGMHHRSHHRRHRDHRHRTMCPCHKDMQALCSSVQSERDEIRAAALGACLEDQVDAIKNQACQAGVRRRIACKSDTNALCPERKTKKHLTKCWAMHSAKLSPSCKAAVQAQPCFSDSQRFCGWAKPSLKFRTMCLRQHSSKLSANCSAYLRSLPAAPSPPVRNGTASTLQEGVSDTTYGRPDWSTGGLPVMATFDVGPLALVLAAAVGGLATVVVMTLCKSWFRSSRAVVSPDQCAVCEGHASADKMKIVKMKALPAAPESSAVPRAPPPPYSSIQEPLPQTDGTLQSSLPFPHFRPVHPGFASATH